MRMKKIGLLAMALVLALGLTGAGFAHWQQVLYINGTLETGEVKVGLRDMGTNDPPPAGPPYYVGAGLGDPGITQAAPYENIYYDKNVASCKSEHGSWDPVDKTFTADAVKCTHEGVDFYEKERITVKNAYPSYAPGWWTEVANCGSIPVKIDPAKFKVTPDPLSEPAWHCWELAKWVKYRDITPGAGVTYAEEANGAAYPFIGTTPDVPGYTGSGDKSWTMYGAECWPELLKALECQQIDPCDRIVVFIELHLMQECLDPGTGEMIPAPQNDTLTFDIEVGFTQWNKVCLT